MPRERRTLKKTDKNKGSQGCIKLAKPEMTLKGFVHNDASITKKKNLIAKGTAPLPSFHDIISSSRRSRSRASHPSSGDDLRYRSDGSNSEDEMLHPPMN